MLLLLVTACDGEAILKPKTIEISNAYSLETPEGFPIAAVFMTIENKTDIDDRLIGFETSYGNRAELHTMSVQNDIMRMRKVDAYNLASGQTHSLKPGADHIMIFGIENTLKSTDTFEGTAVFEQAGKVPVKLTIRPKS